MDTFRNCTKIIVTEEGHAANGMEGTIARKCMADAGAWVNLPGLPKSLASFPDGDSRRDHILLYPDQCSEQAR